MIFSEGSLLETVTMRIIYSFLVPEDGLKLLQTDPFISGGHTIAYISALLRK